MSTLPKPAKEKMKKKGTRGRTKRIIERASGVDRLSDLPEPLLLHILSLLSDMREIARTSVLSTGWRFLWTSVPLFLDLSSKDANDSDSDGGTPYPVASVNRELYCARFFLKTRKFSVHSEYNDDNDKDVDQWVHFATQAAKVEDFTLRLEIDNSSYKYVLPQFAFQNSSLKNLVLQYCKMNPYGSVSWSSLGSLSIRDMKLADRVMKKVLLGCPNLECLELRKCRGIRCLEISSPKLRKFIMKMRGFGDNAQGIEIRTPHVQELQLSGLSHERPLRLKNVASVTTAFLSFTGNDSVDKECRYLNKLLNSLVDVKNLELGLSCIQHLSILARKGLQAPASSRRILTLKGSLGKQHFPAICSLLQSSPDLETFVVDWSRRSGGDYTYEYEDGETFEKHIFDCLLLRLRTIKIINFYVPLTSNRFVLPLVKYLVKNAEVLEKMVIAASLPCNRFRLSLDPSWHFTELKNEILRFPRSSKHAAVVFSYS